MRSSVLITFIFYVIRSASGTTVCRTEATNWLVVQDFYGRNMCALENSNLPYEGVYTSILSRTECLNLCGQGSISCTGFTYFEDTLKCVTHGSVIRNFKHLEGCDSYRLSTLPRYSPPLHQSDCAIELKSYGWQDNPNNYQAYIELNGVRILDASGGSASTAPKYRGLYTAIMIFETCKLYDLQKFDPKSEADEALRLIAYGKSLDPNSIWMGVIASNAWDNLSPAYSYLQSIGLYPLNNNNFDEYGQFMFATQIGNPSKAFYLVRKAGGKNIQAAINIWGTSLSDVQIKLVTQYT